MAVNNDLSIVIFNRKRRVVVIIATRASSLPLSITAPDALKLA
jgi:hypothetical protein